MPNIASAESVEAALADFSFAAAANQIWSNDPKTANWVIGKMAEDKSMLFWDVDAETLVPSVDQSTYTRRDTPTSRRRWQFAVREERRAHLPTGDLT